MGEVKAQQKGNIPNKIHIIGAVGSGKTTLARTLSQKHGIPYYELDNVVWKREKAGDVRRTDEERDGCLDNIIGTDRWIIEGAHNHNWVLKSLRQADLVIFLDTPYPLRIIRIIKRFILQKARLEQSNYSPTLRIFLKMFGWNDKFEKRNKPLILELLRRERMNTLVLKNNMKIDQYIK